MGIGTDNILNNLNSLLSDKNIDKDKKEFSEIDFSSISSEFSNIFNKQFETQFNFKKGGTLSTLSNFDIKQMPSFKIETIANEGTQNFNKKDNENKNVIKDKKDNSSKVADETSSKSQNRDEEVENFSKKVSKDDIKSKDEIKENTDKVQQQTNVEKSEKLSNSNQIDNLKKEEIANSSLKEVQHKQLENIADATDGIDVKKEAPSKDMLKLKVSLEEEVKIQDKAISQKISSEEIELVSDIEIKKEDIASIESKVNEVQKSLDDVDADILKDFGKIEKTTKDIKVSNYNNEKIDKDVSKNVQDDKMDIKENSNIEKINQDVEMLESDVTLHEIVKEKTVSKKALSIDKVDLKDVIEPKNSIMPATTSNLGQNLSGQNQEQNSQQFFQNNQTSTILSLGNIAQNTITGSPFDNVLQTNKLDMSKNITDQVLKNIKGKITHENSQISMILKPANLGRVTLNVINQNGVLSAEIKTETKQAAEALNKNIEELKNTLKEQGVVCANLVVKVEENAKTNNNMNFQQNFKEFKDETSHNGASNGNNNQENKQTYEENITEVMDFLSQEEIIEENTSQSDKLVDYRV